MVRPRRKRGSEALMVEIPLFYEYLAVNFEMMAHDWQWIMSLDEIWYVLLDIDLKPKIVQRQHLKGFLRGESLVSWEGAKVEFARGPFIGKQGTYESGRVCLGVWGKPKVNVFDLIRVA